MNIVIENKGEKMQYNKTFLKGLRGVGVGGGLAHNRFIYIDQKTNAMG